MFLPEGASEPPPAVIFLHGWMMTEPEAYDAWIEHLVSQGYAVIYPVYQDWRFEFPSGKFFERAARGIGAALREFRFDTSKLAVVGHSFGGILGVCLAANAESLDLPRPKALMVVEPGGPPPRCFRPQAIPPQTKLAVVVGQEDRFVGSALGEEIYLRAPCGEKWFFNFWEAEHSSPLCAEKAPLSLSLLAGFSGRDGLEVNELDTLGFWPVLDGLLSLAFVGEGRVAPKEGILAGR